MALLFTSGGSQRVVVANAAALNGSTPISWLAWIYPTSLAPAGNVFIGAKPGMANSLIINTSGQLRVSSQHATTSAMAVAAGLTANDWNFVAGVADGVAAPKLYFGSLKTPAAEASSYVTQIAPMGARVDNTSDVYFGNSIALNQGFAGRIAWASYWTAALSLAQIQAYQKSLAGLVASGCQINTSLGMNGVDATDRSGNGFNGTVSGATQASHAPLTIARIGGGRLLGGFIRRGAA